MGLVKWVCILKKEEYCDEGQILDQISLVSSAVDNTAEI